MYVHVLYIPRYQVGMYLLPRYQVLRDYLQKKRKETKRTKHYLGEKKGLIQLRFMIILLDFYTRGEETEIEKEKKRESRVYHLFFTAPFQSDICSDMSFAASSAVCWRPMASMKSPSGSVGMKNLERGLISHYNKNRGVWVVGICLLGILDILRGGEGTKKHTH